MTEFTLEMQPEGGTAGSGAESMGPDPARSAPPLRRRLQRYRLRLIMRRAQMPDLPRPPLRGVHDLHRHRAQRRPHRPNVRHQATSGSLDHGAYPCAANHETSGERAAALAWAANPAHRSGRRRLSARACAGPLSPRSPGGEARAWPARPRCRSPAGRTTGTAHGGPGQADLTPPPIHPAWPPIAAAGEPRRRRRGHRVQDSDELRHGARAAAGEVQRGHRLPHAR